MNNIVDTLWQIFLIVFYTTGIIFFISLIFSIISGTIKNIKAKNKLNKAIDQLQDYLKTLDKKDEK